MSDRTRTSDELMGHVLRMMSQVEHAAAFGAHLRGRTETLAIPTEVAGAIDHLAGSSFPGLDALPAEAALQAKGALIALFRQAADLLEHPDRAPGWLTDDPIVLQAQGRASAVVADILSTVAPRLEGLAEGLSSGGAFCDVGTGVGWLAMRAARHWPEARIVGLDLDTRPLELARSNLAAEGMAERVELRQLDICTLSGEAFDLVWLPGPFLPRSIVPEAIACASRNLRAGGWIAFGTFGAPPDPVAQAMSDLRTVRAGGYPWSAAELGDLLTGAGLIDVSPVERTWQAPLELVVGRAP